MINSVKIRNYRSIVNASAKLPQFGAIVGLNAAGKSNLISAIELTKLLMLGWELNDAYERYVSIPEEFFNFRDKDFSVPFELEFEITTQEDAKYTFSLAISLNQNIQPSILSIESECLRVGWGNNTKLVYRRNREGLVVTGNGETIPPTINVSNNSLFITVYETPDTEKVKTFFRRISIISSDIKKYHSVSYTRDGEHLRRTDSLSNLISRLMKKSELYPDFLKIIKKLLPNFTDFKEIRVEGTPKIQGKEIAVLMQEKALQRELSSHAYSEGDLRTIALIATAVTQDSYSSLFVEEIENGMHPERARLLVEYLHTFAKVKDLQVNFTTHSPLIINDMSPSNVIYVKKSENGTDFELLSESEDITKIKKLLNEGVNLFDYLKTKGQQL